MEYMKIKSMKSSSAAATIPSQETVEREIKHYLQWEELF